MKLLLLSLFTIFNSFLFSECSELSSSDCNGNCNWVEDIETGYCGNHNSSASCPNYPSCSWSCQGGWYLGECVGWYACTGGSYEIDNSYCEETQMPSCSDLSTESSCNLTDHLDISCEWIEDVEIIYCNTLPTSGWGPGVCEYYYPDCYNYLDYGGSYGSWSTECGGGTTQIDNSYCAEMQYQLGDINQDNTINIQDVILTVNLVLNVEYDNSADMNSDNILNVLDIIQLVNMILN